MSQKILLTGGAGFIGSHTYVELVAAGYEVVIIDDFSNAHHDVLDRLEVIAGGKVTCYEGDVLDGALLDRIFAEHDIAAAIHFAARRRWAKARKSRSNTCRSTSPGSIPC